MGAPSGDGDGPATVTLDKAGLLVGTDPLPLVGGAMHYFRVRRRHWGRCLDALVELGLPLVQSYVPWAVHEREPGRFDFGDGPRVEGFERDLGGFLDACAERGLRVLLRPGPHINAELTYFGYPKRVLQDQRCLAVGSRGNPVILPAPPRAFPVPSYASEQFHHEAAIWLKAFGDHVARYVWPDGPVVAVQVDNELSMFFRTGAYDQDYHQDAIALYREFLQRRYSDAIPGAYKGTDPEPPRKFDAQSREDLVVHLDWVAFKEWMVVRALRRMARVLSMCGLDRIVQTHNFAAQGWGLPCSIVAAEDAVDVAGLDIYLAKRDYTAAKQHALSLAGASRLPFVPELGCGGLPWWFPFSWEDQRNVALAMLMHGVKGLSLYMAVERDRWFGAPVGPDGQRRRGLFEAVRELISAVKGTDTTPSLPTLGRNVDIGLMRVRDYERLSLCSALSDPLPPAALDLVGVRMADVMPLQPTPGLERSAALEYATTVSKAAAALDRLRLPYHYVDSELPAERLDRYRLLVVPTLGFMDTELVERLRSFVVRGGRLLLVGDEPALDRSLQPVHHELPVHQRVGTDPDLAEAADPDLAPVALGAVLDRIGQDLGIEPEPFADGVETAVFRDTAGRPRVLFVANPHGTEAEPAVPALQQLEAQDAVGGQPVDLRHVRLRPWEVKMLSLLGDRPQEGDRPREDGSA